MSKSKLGYKRNSPYKNEPSIEIDSNRITMQDVDIPLLGIGDGGEVKMMYPGEEHLFPNSKKVTEIPVMQQGGKLGGFKDKWLKQKFQDGGLKPLDLSKYSKEQYKYLYDTKRLATYDQANETYQVAPLEGVDIVAKQPKSASRFFDKFKDKLSRDHSGSLASAMFMLPVDAVSSLPQAAMTYLLSENGDLEPSTALGVENKWGAMATDMALDPTNLVGAGLLTKGTLAAKTVKGLGRKTLKAADDFTSEIDWAKWNKEIPTNKPLIKEYNEIEKVAKANGTWMKNPDGTIFKGTPEQFVQQNSQNFKKAFPNPIKDEAGNVQYNYHGQRAGKPFSVFKQSERGNHGKGNYTFAGERERALKFANNDEKRLYEVYINSNNPQRTIPSVFDESFNSVSGRLQPEFDYLKVGKEQVTPQSNYLKSAIGNNGMFDMSNPNIYKALAPLVAAGASQAEYQKGGLVEFKDRWLKQKFQNGGQPLDLSKLSKQEYADLYNQGRLATYDKQTDTYQTPVLEGVDIIAKKPKSLKGFAKKYMDKLTEDHGSSLTSSMFMLPVDAVAGLPQAAMTYLLSDGEVQPSKALNIENPIGAFAVDAVLDPTNLVGAGYAKNTVKAMKYARQNKIKALREALTVGEHYTTEAAERAFKNRKEDLVSHLKTEEGQKRLNAIIQDGDTSVGESNYIINPTEMKRKALTKNLENLELMGHDNKFEIPLSEGRAFYHRRGVNLFHNDPSERGVHIGRNFTSDRGELNKVIEHELNHATQDVPYSLPMPGGTYLDKALDKLELKSKLPMVVKAKIEDFTPNNFTPTSKTFMTEVKKSGPNRWDAEARDYFKTGSDGSEKSSFLAEVREDMRQKGIISDRYDKITPEMLEEHYKEYKKLGKDAYPLRIYDIMKNSPTNFKLLSETVNKLPVVLPVAAAASSGEKQNGGKVQTFTSKWIQHGR